VTIFADRLYCNIEFALPTTRDKNVRTIYDEPLCNSEAYAAVSACDYYDFSFELFHNFIFIGKLSL
jgi:hypothetical protein